MRDTVGRNIDYLRVSVTDLCNLRCAYCMPEQGVAKRRHEENLTVEEILAILREAAALGISKVRLTGGEPLVRRGILDVCRGIAEIPGIAEVAMTTNGLLLEEMAGPLRDAGVQRLNISLDTLHPERYAALTRGGELHRALAGMEAARKAGFRHMKLNVVLMGGFNEDEIPAFVEWTRDQEIQVRFIELMPVGECADWPPSRFIPAEEVLRQVPELTFLHTQGVAGVYQVAGHTGTVGLIRPMSQHFCGTCNRLRLTADGRLKPCLHAALEIPLKGADAEQVRAGLMEAIAAKPRGHELAQSGRSASGRPMYRIGG